MAKVLVTGGAGFIGSHLCQALVKRGYKITIVDDLSTGDLDNLKGLPYEFVRGSVTDLPLMMAMCKGVDAVFHLAAMNRAPRSVENPVDANKVNVDGTLNVLVASRSSDVKKVVYSSSSSIYGGGEPPVKREDMKPSPETPYAVGKLAGEHYCDVFQKLFGLPTLILRYFSVYGRRQRYDIEYAAVIPVFIDRLRHKLPPVIYGDGQQTRDFTFVSDVVDVTILLAESDKTGIFNVNCGRPVSVNDLALEISRLLRVDIAPVYQSPRAGEVRHLSGDIGRLSGLGFVPSYDIQKGLGEMISGEK